MNKTIYNTLPAHGYAGHACNELCIIAVKNPAYVETEIPEIELWFEGYVGLDKRVTVTKLPDNFGSENWELLDLAIDDEPTIPIDDGEQGFYRFTLEVIHGWEGSSDDDYGFEIVEWNRIK